MFEGLFLAFKAKKVDFLFGIIPLVALRAIAVQQRIDILLKRGFYVMRKVSRHKGNANRSRKAKN